MNCFVTLLYVCNRKLQLRRSCVFLKIRQISSILWHTYGIYRFVVDTDDDFHGQKDREEALNGWESCHDTQSHSMLSHDWIIKTETYKMRLLSLLFPIRRNLLTPVWRSIRTIEEILEFETCESFSVKFFGLWMDYCWFQTKMSIRETLYSNGQTSSVLELSSENDMNFGTKTTLDFIYGETNYDSHRPEEVPAIRRKNLKYLFCSSMMFL